MNDLRIVFMGTPTFSVGILNAMKNANKNIVGIVTVADKPAGRGQQMHESPVKQFAIENTIPVLQPEKLKDATFLSELAALNADVFVVVAFRMLPKEVWQMPKKGTFNLHASLLPDYRGAAPINWSIINGDKITGVSTFFIDEKIDTGNIIGQTEMEIADNETAGELHDRMIITGGDLVVETLNRIALDNVSLTPQENCIDSPIRPAPKLFKENTKINWTDSVEKIHQLICGLSPYPTAWSVWENSKGEKKTIKFFKSTWLTETSDRATLSLWNDKQTIYVKCDSGILCIHEFQIEGKKRLLAKDWLVGNACSDWKIAQ
jgi:methionyl-tRNA formyltransferase